MKRATGLVALMAWMAALNGLGPAWGDGKPQEKKSRLEFRILANQLDDAKALDAVKKYFAEAKEDNRRKEELKKLAEEGKPPAPLKVATDKAPGYTWLEIGEAELRSLHLIEDGKEAKRDGDVDWNAFRKEVAEARDNEKPITLSHRLAECLFYSRRAMKPRQNESGKRQFEFFLLTRDPEKGKAVTGEYLVEVKAEEFNGPAIRFRLNKTGADLFRELTSPNKPDKETGFRRHLAIILDGKIMCSPGIVYTIGSEGMINGNFTQAEVDAIVDVLRSDLRKDKK